MGDDAIISTEMRLYAERRGYALRAPDVQSKTIDDGTLRQIALLAKVDPRDKERYGGLAQNLNAAVADAWEATRAEKDDPQRSSEPVYRSDAVDELEARKQAIEKVRSLFYGKPISAASMHAQRHVRMFLSRIEKDAMADFDNLFKYALDRYDESILQAISLVNIEYNSTGRPTGIGGVAGNNAVFIFAKQLHYAVMINGSGKLTYSRTWGRAGGTLSKILDLLRDHLPRNFLPGNEAKHIWEKAAAEAARELADESRQDSG